MIRWFSAPIVALAGFVAFGWITQTPAAGQTPEPSKKKPAAATPAIARTPWGDPDLQGVYTFSTNTPLERPNGLVGKESYTEAELTALEEQAAAGYNAEGRKPRAGDVGTYNNFWTSNEKGKLTGRTSLIVNPENGRMPPLTERAQKVHDKLAAEAAARRIGTPPFVQTLYDTWEDHPVYTRCIARPMPRIWQSYNHGIQILQTPGFVIIDYESMHDVRIIPVDGRPHLDPDIHQWNGDSRGHWDGNTLVIDWTNFTDKQEFPEYGSGGAAEGNVHVIERLKRVDANTIDDEVTVNDPTTWTKPWTFIVPWRADDPNYQKPEDLYEFACHEGNYRMMEDTLAGSRALREKQEAKKHE
jgi:hypothetical protein